MNRADLILWAVLFVQGASFAWVSRARSSGSIAYAALVGVFSHGAWFATQAILVTSITAAAQNAAPLEFARLAAVYVSAMICGQTAAMVVSIRFLEKGARAVGGKS